MASSAKSKLAASAYKAIAIIQKSEMPVDIQLHIFESTVALILLYGSEVWYP